MKLEFFLEVFKRYSSVIFDENLSNGSGVVPYGQRGKRRTDMMKLIVALRNSASTSESCMFIMF
jgi:hypothetical protein